MLRHVIRRARLASLTVDKVQHRCLQTSPALCKLTDFQVNKLMSEFDRFYDRDSDGFVCKKDIELLKKQMTIFSTTMKGTAYRQLEKHGYDDFWVLFREMADTNRDGRLSKEEWIDLWTKIDDKAADRVDFESLPQWIRLMIYTLFPIIDVKGDGHIDKEEYKHFWFELTGSKVDSKTLDKMWSSMLKEGEENIDHASFQALYADYYLSKDASSPGKYIAGPVEI